MRSSILRSLAALACCTFVACSDSDDSTNPSSCSVTSVSVTPSPGTVEVGATVTLTANITQQNCTGLTVAWSSSNTAIATVADGVVTGAAVGGPVMITATVSGKSGSTNLTVVQAAVATVTLANTYNAMAVGVQNTVTATLRDSRGTVLTGRTINWTTSNGGVVSVTPAGVIAGVALGGPVDITATSEGKSASVQMSVVPRYAYLYANTPGATAPYDAPGPGSYSTIGALSQVTRISLGRYSVRVRNMAAGTRPVAVIPNAIAQGNSTCMATGQSDDGADFLVDIECRDSVAGLTDLLFTLTVFGSDAFPGRFGMAFANQETAATYNPPANRSFNAAGQPIDIIRNSTGNYTVRFNGNGRDGASPAETFMVSAADVSGNAHCEIIVWSFTTASATVRCADGLGFVRDTKFTIVMLEAGRPAQRHALAWVNCGATSCTPPAAFARSSSGGAITVTRLSTGRYDVVFAGLRRVSGSDNVLVTSYGDTGGFCKVIAFDNSGTNDFTATVSCLGAGASVSDRFFTIAIIP